MTRAYRERPAKDVEGKDLVRVGIRVSDAADDYMRENWTQRGDIAKMIGAAFGQFDPITVGQRDETRPRMCTTTVWIPAQLYSAIRAMSLETDLSQACIVDSAVLRYAQQQRIEARAKAEQRPPGKEKL